MKKYFASRFSKVVAFLASIACITVLASNLDFEECMSSLQRSASVRLFLLYALLSGASLIARTQRFILLYSHPQGDSSLDKTRPTCKRNGISFLPVFLASSVRNIAVNAVPFRLGELVIPTILTAWKMPISASIHPLWISGLYDASALLLIASLYICYTLSGTSDEIALELYPSAEIGFLIAIGGLVLAGTALVIPMLSKKVLQSALQMPFLTFLTNRFPFIAVSVESITSISFPLACRVFLLSIAVRVSKYTALSILFFAVHADIVSGTREVLTAVACFILAEGTSSLPGSGVLSFGAYELSFVWLAGLSESLPGVTVSSLTSVHILSFLFEMLLMLLCTLSAAFRLWGTGRTKRSTAKP